MEPQKLKHRLITIWKLAQLGESTALRPPIPYRPNPAREGFSRIERDLRLLLRELEMEERLGKLTG